MSAQITDRAGGAKRSHRAVAVLLALAVICGFLAVFSLWVRRQALDTGNWTDTSGRLLESQHIRAAVGGFLVEELFSNTDVAANLRKRLPAQTKALADPAAAGLRELADNAAPRLLGRPRVQLAWVDANRAAHRELLQILNGGRGPVSTRGGVVTLDLRALISDLAATLGLQKQLAAVRNKVGARPVGQLVIMRSSQLKTAQRAVKAVRKLSIVFSFVSLALFALAVWLAEGWRRLALRRVGWCFLGIAVAILLVRRAAGDAIVSGLVRAESEKPAAHDAWQIATSLLYAIAAAMALYGLFILAAVWLAGPSRSGSAVRRAITPTLRDRPAVTWGVAAFLYLLLLLWGPTAALRDPISILVIAALLAFGLVLLRRESLKEFADARAGETMDAIRARIRGWRAATKGSGTSSVPTSTGEAARIEQLERLASLHGSGALSDREFEAEKALLLRP